ncbi:MAG: hypothetical protein GY861_12490 [bacterium]|nr:hypothetical protein [bacterium]
MADTETKVDYITVGEQTASVFDSTVVPRELSAEEIAYYYDNVNRKGGDEVLPDF